VVGEKKILALVDSTPPPGDFPKNFDMPLAWPMPSWGKWQLRDVYEISAGKIPSKAAGYCYGKRVMYVDKATYAPVWEDLYDSKMQLWRIFGMFMHTVDVPDIGPVTASGAMVWASVTCETPMPLSSSIPRPATPSMSMSRRRGSILI
jgi:hypothetical protein